MAEQQFICVMEPLDSWAVWDELTGEPVAIDGELLVGLADEAARSTCHDLNLRENASKTQSC